MIAVEEVTFVPFGQGVGGIGAPVLAGRIRVPSAIDTVYLEVATVEVVVGVTVLVVPAVNALRN